MEIKSFQYKGTMVCSSCLMDNTVRGITFDENGVCTFCHIHNEIENQYPLGSKTDEKLNAIVAQIKKEGKNKKYDCVLGVSGGRDSTYTLFKAVELGLRPLAVHFDNGWNTEIAVKNINTKRDGISSSLLTDDAKSVVA